MSAAKRWSDSGRIGVGDFASAKLNDGFYAIAFLEEANGMVLFEVVVVIIGVGAELQFLHQDDVLFLAGVVLLLLYFVLPLAVSMAFATGGSAVGAMQIRSRPSSLPSGWPGPFS